MKMSDGILVSDILKKISPHDQPILDLLMIDRNEMTKIQLANHFKRSRSDIGFSLERLKIGGHIKQESRYGKWHAVNYDFSTEIANKRPEEVVKKTNRLEKEIAELKLEDKRSFFSGVAVSLQAIAFFGDSAIAEEIVSGLGGDKEEFYEYLKSEGGVDLDTYRYLIKNNTADILSTFDAIECECGCDITQEVMSLNEGQFDCSCGAEISWKEKLNQEGEE